MGACRRQARNHNFHRSGLAIVVGEPDDTASITCPLVSSLTSDSKGRILFSELQKGKIWLLTPRLDGSFTKSLLADIPLPADLGNEHGIYQSSLNPDGSYLYVMATETTDRDQWAGDTSQQAFCE